MIKKLMFVLLVGILFTVGSVVSMADDDTVQTNDKNQESVIPAAAVEGLYIDGYSNQAVIDKYAEIFFDENNQASGVYLVEGETRLVKDEDSDSIQDYKLTATMLDTVRLANGDSIVIMAFVKTDGTYQLLTTPKNLSWTWLRWYKVSLPHTGKDNPNHVRVIAFLRSQWESLQLGVNLEITDLLEIIENDDRGFDFLRSLKNCTDTIRQVGNILQ
jgi:hypothetical protein